MQQLMDHDVLGQIEGQVKNVVGKSERARGRDGSPFVDHCADLNAADLNTDALRPLMDQSMELLDAVGLVEERLGHRQIGQACGDEVLDGFAVGIEVMGNERDCSARCDLIQQVVGQRLDLLGVNGLGQVGQELLPEFGADAAL